MVLAAALKELRAVIEPGDGVEGRFVLALIGVAEAALKVEGLGCLDGDCPLAPALRDLAAALGDS